MAPEKLQYYRNLQKSLDSIEDTDFVNLIQDYEHLYNIYEEMLFRFAEQTRMSLAEVSLWLGEMWDVENVSVGEADQWIETMHKTLKIKSKFRNSKSETS